ncbi:MAG: HD domain-containing protein [Ktedonobacterales bacterium]
MKLRPLPDEVVHLLDNVDAPPRVIAQIDVAWPSLDYDRHAVALGAAVHDIGKVMYPDELSRPGNVHEAGGEALLVERGFPRAIARFVRTHGQWRAEEMPLLEDLMVALADALWRDKRDPELEDVLCGRIATLTDDAYWQVFARLDDIASEIAAYADARLSWQEEYVL